MEAKWFFIFWIVVVLSVCSKLTVENYNATKAGLEECPKYGAGQGGDSIWVKSCTEYSKIIIENKRK